MNAIYKFVMAQLAKGAAKRTGITTISRADDIMVRASARQIERTLEKMGVDVSKITSPKEVEKLLDIQASWLKQTPKKSKPPADVLDLSGKKIDTSKPILGGKNVPETEAEIAARLTKQNKETVANINQQMIEEDRAIKDMYRTTGGGTRTLDEDAGYLAEFLADDAGKFLDDLPKAEQTKFYDRAYKALVRHQKKKLDPEDFAGGGIAGMLGEPTYADEDHRVPLGGGKFVFDAARRKFLQAMGAGAAGVGAAKAGLFGLLKGSKSAVVKDLTSVPIKNIDGMPLWFKPLVNKVIAQGDDVSKRFATQERQIVHQSTLPDSKTPVIVTQDLNTGDVLVDIGMGKHGFKEGHLGQPVRLEYKAAEDIMSGPSDEPFKVGVRDPLLRIKSSVHEDLVGSGLKGDPKTLSLKPGKTKEEFWVEEAEFSGGHPENVKFEDVSIEKFGEHGSNFDEVEKFATGKVKKVKKKQGTVGWSSTKYRYEGDMASGGRVPLSGGKSPDPSDATTTQLLDILFDEGFDMEGILRMLKQSQVGNQGDFSSGYQSTWRKAEGGRVPLGKGKLAKYATPEGLAALIEKLFPGTTKLGKTSKTMADKTQLRRAIADFRKREKKARQLTDDEYDDFVDELGGEDQLEAYTFDGTVGDSQRILKEHKDYHDYMYQQYKTGKLEPKAGEVNRGRLKLLRERSDEAGMSGDQKLFSRDEMDELEYLEDHFAQVDKEEAFQFAERIREAKANKKSPWYTDPKTLTPEEELRREFPGIDDKMIKNILADKNPQRIAEVKASLHEALKMQQKGMGHEEIMKALRDSWGRKKNASGGRVSLSAGGLAGMLGE
jgi:hypothetical protein